MSAGQAPGQGRGGEGGTARLRIGVLGSGRGTAVEALLQATARGEVDAEVVLIVTDRKGAAILERAERYGVQATYLDPTGLSRELYDDCLTALLVASRVDLVLMAGFMRIVSPALTKAWRGRLLNVHPSLLPAFAGLVNLRVHEAVLESGASETGCTIHQVNDMVDGGEIVLQKRCAVLVGDTPEVLRDRVQALENEAFVEVVRVWAGVGSAAAADGSRVEPALEAGPKLSEEAKPVEKAADERRGKPEALRVGIIMGSRSDWPTMKAVAATLEELGVAYEAEVVSAHRTPEKMFAYARGAQGRGLQVIVAGAGGAAHLPGMMAALTQLPVLGVPVESKALSGLDSLLSIVQMPGGVPVATFAIGTSGARNAGLFAAALLALNDEALSGRLKALRQRQTEAVLAEADPRV